MRSTREWLEPIGRLQEWLTEDARLDPRSDQAKVLLPELAAQVEEAEQAQAATVLAVSTLHFHTDRREPKPILARSWKLAEGKHKCQYARPAVIELGEQQGRFIQVCIEKKKCAKHWPQQKTGVNSSTERADNERRRAEEERRRQEQERRRRLFEQHIRPNTLKALAAAMQRRAFTGIVFLEVLKQLRPSRATKSSSRWSANPRRCRLLALPRRASSRWRSGSPGIRIIRRHSRGGLA